MIENRYEENKARLQHGIRKGKISLLEIDSKDHACYFCKKHIDGKVKLLIMEEKKSITKIPINESCYRLAKIFEYYKGMPVSLN